MVADTKFSLYSILLCTIIASYILERNGSRKKQDRGENIAATTARRSSNVKKKINMARSEYEISLRVLLYFR